MNERWPSITRIYTDHHHASAFEDIYVPMTEIGGGLECAEIPCESFSFREKPDANVIPLHPAPRRQLLITLDGILEIEATNGDTRRFGPGQMLFADDMQSSGHVARQLGNRKSLVIRLSEDLDISTWRP